MSPSDSFLNIFVGNSVLGMPTYICWILIFSLLIFSGFFSASETAFSASNKYLFKVKADEGSKIAKIIYFFIDKFDDTLISILVSYNIIQTLTSFICAMLWLNICERYGIANGLDAVFSTITISVSAYLLSDVIPKVITIKIPNKMCYVLVFPISIFYVLTYPIALIFKGILISFQKLFKINQNKLLTKEDFFIQADEAVIEEDKDLSSGEQEELFEDNELKILKKAFNFDNIEVKSILTPKEKMFMISHDELTYDNINKIVSEVTFSRIPIYKDNKDNIEGVLIIRDFYKEYIHDPHFNIESIIVEPIFVDSNMKIDDIFDYFNKEKTHIGFVKDGDKVLGLITMEDILEELVGDINEETRSEGE